MISIIDQISIFFDSFDAWNNVEIWQIEIN